jgi:hypothetical protein
MVSFVELRDCEPAAFGLSGQRWQQLAGQVAYRGNEVDMHLAELAAWARAATETDEHAADALRKLSAQATGFAPAPNDPTVMSPSQRIPSKASPADVRT